MANDGLKRWPYVYALCIPKLYIEDLGSEASSLLFPKTYSERSNCDSYLSFFLYPDIERMFLNPVTSVVVAS